MKTTRVIVIALLLITAVNAIVAGILFMLDPSGAGLGLSVGILQYSPFADFLIPGVILFVVNGILNLVAATYAVFQWKGWKMLLLIQGVVLFSWIVIQVIMLHQLHYLHFIFAGIAVLLILYGVSPGKSPVRK